MEIDRRRQKNMLDCIGMPAMLEQLAEEATELAKAALKLARIIRGENPTPVTKSQAIDNLVEEYTDVVQCARELEVSPDEVQMKMKEMRFIRRWVASRRHER